MRNKHIKRILIAAVVVIALYFMPFITVMGKTSDGTSVRIPFASWFKDKTEDTVTFSSVRSAYALGRDAENALHSYEESTCYGKTYYYDADGDVSYYAHSQEGILPASVTYSYVSGNACAGWTTDDEIAWEFGDLADLDWNITPDEAMEKGWFVMEDGKASNLAAYNDFSRMIKQGVYCQQRILLYENGQLVEAIDLQLLENAKYRAAIRTAEGVSEEEYARLSDQENDTGEKEVCVYNGSFKEEEPIVLFTIKE